MAASERKLEISLEQFREAAKKWRKKMLEMACPELKEMSEDEFEEKQKLLTRPILSIEQSQHFARLSKINLKRFQKNNGNETDNQ